MPKRQRQYHEGDKYRTKRRRYTGESEERADALARDNERNVTLLKIKVDILRAQITILRREIQELRQTEQKDTIKEHRNCVLM